VEDVSRDREEDGGWCTVRRARSRYSPGVAKVSSAADLAKRGKVQGCRAATRFKMPSSAMSLPSLAFIDQEVSRMEPGKVGESFKDEQTPRGQDAKLSRLGRLAEGNVGSSAESLSGEDPSRIKKKKDLFNRNKQNNIKSAKNKDVKEKSAEKSKIVKTKSAPLVQPKSGAKKVEVPVKQGKRDISQASDEPGKDASPIRDSVQDEDTSVIGVVTASEDDKKLSKSVQDELDDDGEMEEHEKAIALAELEAADLEREIRETERAELTDTDNDNDPSIDTDTDTGDPSSEPGDVASSEAASRYEAILESLSWAEQLELEEQIGDMPESRYPGRAIQLHEKLSSPARRREPAETFKHYQEKQDKAQARRARFNDEKASKLMILNTRIEEVLKQKDVLVGEGKGMIDDKQKRAEENKKRHLEGIRKKAHEEEEKLKEIAFINELQAQNTRFDMIAQVTTMDEKCEERLAELAEERAKKAEQREEREARAEERRKAIEEERQRHLDEMLERRRTREERIQGELEAQREQRMESARNKARDRQERLSTVRAAEQDMKEELLEKIQQKQEEAVIRHAEHLQHIREKAFELSVQTCSTDDGVPLIKPYPTMKKCEVCDVIIRSEVHLQSHLRGKQHQEAISRVSQGRKLSGAEMLDYNLKHIVDAPEGEADPRSIQAKERIKAARKRAKKIKNRMLSKAVEYEATLPPVNKHFDSPNRAKVGKSLREIDKLLKSQGKGAWPNNAVSSLERSFGEMCRAFDKNQHKDQGVFYNLEGFQILGRIYQMLAECHGDNTCVIPIKSLVSAGKVVIKATKDNYHNTNYLLMSNRLTLIVDILLDRLSRLVPSSDNPDQGEVDVEGPQTDPLSQSLMSLLSSCIQQLAAVNSPQQGPSRLQDLVSYIVSSGIVDQLAGYFQSVRDPIDSSQEVTDFLLSSLELLTSLTAVVDTHNDSDVTSESGRSVNNQQPEDPTNLMSSLHWTEMAGTVSMLYGMLLHQGRDTRGNTRCTPGQGDMEGESTPPELPAHTLAVTSATCTLIHRIVKSRLTMVQEVLGSEGTSLEFRHIASYLLWYCQHHNETALLNLVIILVGYFTAGNQDNQAIVQSGSQPSVLQQLANLPFQYFSQPSLRLVLFPSLLSCCRNNKENTAILTQEMAWQLIQDFIQTQEGADNHLVQLILSEQNIKSDESMSKTGYGDHVQEVTQEEIQGT